MLVKNWMSRNVITIDAEESMYRAIKMMKQHKIKVLPVMEKEKIVGIISNGDIKKASASEATTLDVYELAYLLEKLKIRDIMSKPVITGKATQTVDEVAEILLDKNISSLPIVDENKKLIGIITESDIFKVLISLTGMHRRAVDYGFEVPDEPGSIKEITDLIRAYGGRISSVLISYDQAPVGKRNVYMRIYQADQKELKQLNNELMKQTKVLYFLDFINSSREIF